MKPWLKNGIVGGMIGIFIFLIFVYLHDVRGTGVQPAWSLIFFSIIFYALGCILLMKYIRHLKQKNKTISVFRGFVFGLGYGIVSFLIRYIIPPMNSTPIGTLARLFGNNLTLLNMGQLINPIWFFVKEFVIPLFLGPYVHIITIVIIILFVITLYGLIWGGIFKLYRILCRKYGNV